jgi:hypothetical protein
MVRLKDSTTARNRTRKVGVAAAAVASVAGMMFAAAPATATVAAYPTSVFSIVYGESHYNGTITWYNRSVHVTGGFKATGCRRVYARAFPSSANVDFVSSSTWCNTSGPVTLPLDTSNVIGGPSKIWVYMTDGDQRFLEGETCYPSRSYCDFGLH